MIWFINLILIAVLVSAGSAANTAGLFVGADGLLQKNGGPYRGIGVNYYDAFTRALSQPPLTNYDAGFRELAARKIPFVRFSAGGYWPSEWKLYQTNR